MSNVVKVLIDLDECWIFVPQVEGQLDLFGHRQELADKMFEAGHYVELSREYLEQYARVSQQFWTMNSELEELYRKHFMKGNTPLVP